MDIKMGGIQFDHIGIICNNVDSVGGLGDNDLLVKVNGCVPE